MNRLIIIFLIVTTAVFGQTVGSRPDSLTSNDSSRVLLRSPMTLQNINTLEIRESFFTDFSAFPELAIMQAELSDNAGKPDVKELKANLLANFQQSMKWKSDYSLGVFGQVLGYAMSAATVGLAVKHIAKYKGKAFFGK